MPRTAVIDLRFRCRGERKSAAAVRGLCSLEVYENDDDASGPFSVDRVHSSRRFFQPELWPPFLLLSLSDFSSYDFSFRRDSAKRNFSVKRRDQTIELDKLIVGGSYAERETSS